MFTWNSSRVSKDLSKSIRLNCYFNRESPGQWLHTRAGEFAS